MSIDAELTRAERWRMAWAVIRAGLRGYYVDPVSRWAMAKSPAWVVKIRLQRAEQGWYRIRSRSVAYHCRLRFDVYPLDVGDMLRVRGGKVSHVAYCGLKHTEILEFLANGDLAAAPEIPEMRLAWAMFFSTARANIIQEVDDDRGFGE